MKNLMLLLVILVGISSQLFAQKPISFGFRSGIGYSNILSDGLEEGESFNNAFGFHVGMLFQYNVLKNLAIRTEFSYVQRGADYAFTGKGYDIVKSNVLSDVLVTGDKKLRIAHIVDYLDFPISIAYKPFKALEINGGIYFSTMLTAKATGSKTLLAENHRIAEYGQVLDYNYKKDGFPSVKSDDVTTLTINNNFYSIPTEIGAYYDFDLKGEKLFNAFDMGWQIGASIFVNESLFFGVKYYRGGRDVMNNKADVSPSMLTDVETPVLRSKNDQNGLFQISLGFAF